MRGPAEAAKHLVDRVRSMVLLEVQEAVNKLKRKVAAVGLGIGLLLGAAVFGLFALGFALATIAAAIATVLSTWLALLVVTGALFLLAGVLVAIGVGAIRKGTIRNGSEPAPEQATDATPRP